MYEWSSPRMVLAAQFGAFAVENASRRRLVPSSVDAFRNSVDPDADENAPPISASIYLAGNRDHNEFGRGEVASGLQQLGRRILSFNWSQRRRTLCDTDDGDFAINDESGREACNHGTE